MSGAYAVKAYDASTAFEWPVIWVFSGNFSPVHKFEVFELDETIVGLQTAEMNVAAGYKGLFICSAQIQYDDWNVYATFIFAIDHLGKLVWSVRAEGFDESRDLNLVRLHEDVLYVSHPSPTGITAYNPATGDILWESGEPPATGSIHMAHDGNGLNVPQGAFSNPHVRFMDLNGNVTFNEPLGNNANTFYQLDYNDRFISATTWLNTLRAFNQDMSVAWSRPDERHLSAIRDGEFAYSVYTDFDASEARLAKYSLDTGAHTWSLLKTGISATLLGKPHPVHDDEHFYIRYVDGDSYVQKIRKSDGGHEWDQSISDNYQANCDDPQGFVIARDPFNKTVFDRVSFDGVVENNLGGLNLWDDLQSYLGSSGGEGPATGASSMQWVQVDGGIPSLRLLQRDDDNDHGHPRISREQVTSEQKSIRRGPGTYW